jgi:hypothetical protein
MGFDLSFEYEKNILFSYFNRKGFIRTETRWYFICSEYNLFDEGDEEFNSKLRPFLEGHFQKSKNLSN